MLSQLYIENIAVIEKADIEFFEGLNVLTGETGTGKSILIDAIFAILGERTSRDLIRTGALKAKVIATFSGVGNQVINKLKELDFDISDDDLMVQREIGQDGKNSCRINGVPASVAVLKEIGGYLININGQHDSYSLINIDKHREYIDAYGFLENDILEYKRVYDEMSKVKRELEEINIDENEKARRIDLLKFQINEIETANLEENEDILLQNRKKIIQNSERILEELNEAYFSISGDENRAGALSLIQTAGDALKTACQYYPELLKGSDRLSDFYYELDEISNDVRACVDELEFDPKELENIENRLDLIFSLRRKYGNSVLDILNYYNKCVQELEGIEFTEERQLKLKKDYDLLFIKANVLANSLSDKRKISADEFTKKVLLELNFLDMPNVVLQAQITKTELSPTGIDKIEFLISPNLGELPKPLNKIASGGELSRIMLSIKNVMSKNDNNAALIFDEIDTGVSGSAAMKIGQKLKSISTIKQVICVTHQAQIAALADEQLLIIKKVEDGRTYTEVKRLQRDERISEISRIMGGINITELMKKNADEMLRLAGN